MGEVSGKPNVDNSHQSCVFFGKFWWFNSEKLRGTVLWQFFWVWSSEAAEIPNLDETHLLQVNPPGKTVYRCILVHVFFAKPNRFQLQPQALELCPIELDIYVISK